MIYFNNYEVVKNFTFDFITVQKGKQYIKSCQNIMTFDIETSNGYLKNKVVYPFDYSKGKIEGYYDEYIPISLMYVWQLALKHDDTIDIFMGRTWEEFEAFLKELTKEIMLQANGWYLTKNGYDDATRNQIFSQVKARHKQFQLHLYIHNLGFEFQHLRNVFEKNFSRSKNSVFARSQRKPMKVEFTYNYSKVILHDTLCLTQKSLDNWCKDSKLPVKKLTGTFDYLKIRTPRTKLTKTEIDYCVNDVLSMIYGVQQYKDKYESLDDIPMTQTGEVRRTCIREIAQKNIDWSLKCKEVLNNMSFERYQQLSACFAGGWTHANAMYTNRVVKNMKCFDFRSSYPGVMVSRKFPVESFHACTVNDIETYEQKDLWDRDYNFYVKVEFTNVCSKTFNTFWSYSKCEKIEGVIADNGRIKECETLVCWMTDLDFDTFKKSYNYETMTIKEAYSAKCDYLPYEFIYLILMYYLNKTKLKGTGRESEYNEAKQFINSIYGVNVTKIITDIVGFLAGWEKHSATENDYYEMIDKMTRKDVFYTYQIGVWVAAWARHNLWDAILELDFRTVYCDTDSIKGIFTDEDLDWFNNYNNKIWKQCEKVAKIRNIDINLYRPSTPKGVVKEIGFFDREEDYIEFKTLGAKRYCALVHNYEDNIDEIHTTIAGLPKDAGVIKIKNVEDFDDGLVWDCEESGKLVSYYNDKQPVAKWVDENGDEYISHDGYGLNLMPTSFSLDINDDYRMLYELLQGYDNMLYDTPKIIRESNQKYLTDYNNVL